ncbi:hypothetical protein K438DRAFT_269479 [Mycena galopus ATCC 62051]|nr:hypothetical protein K438DRAFT_269479 [Mycena galopus ATCC 62051]
MACVVEYLNSIHWESAQVPFDLAEPKLTRVADKLEHLCSGSNSEKRPAKSGGSSARAQAHEPSARTDANSRPSFVREPGYEQRMDQLFRASTTTKSKSKPSKKRRGGNNSHEAGDDSDSSYPFRRPRACSEEADDEFDFMEIERPPTPEVVSFRRRFYMLKPDVLQGSGKRRRVVIDGEGSADEGSKSRPKKKAKKAKQLPPSAPPKVTVVEVPDSDSDDEQPEAKRGPSSTSRNHFHPAIAVKFNPIGLQGSLPSGVGD